MPAPRLLLLGAPEFWLGEVRLAFPTRKALGLLAYLAVEGPSERGHLADLLWQGDEERARANLRNELFRLKRSPLGAFLEDAGGRLRLNGVTTDLAEFDEMMRRSLWAEAIKRYRGRLLSGLELKDAPVFEEWLSLVRERYEERYNAALAALATQQESAGALEEALESRRRLLARNFLHEASHRAVMRILASQGEAAEALAQYRRYTKFLERELGTQASPQTQALARALQGGVPQLSKPRPAPPPGCEALWERLEEAVQAGQFAFLQGPPETTKLMLTFATAQGFRLGLMEAQPEDRDAPYATLARVTRRMLSFRPAYMFEPEVQRELSRLVPEVGENPPPLRTIEDRLRFFKVMTAFIHSMMPRDFAKVADKLHYFDPQSLELILYETEQGRKAGDRRPHLASFDARQLSSDNRALMDDHIAAGLGVLLEV